MALQTTTLKARTADPAVKDMLFCDLSGTGAGPFVPARVDVDGSGAVGAPIAGAAMPAGGAGMTGWLSALWAKLSGTLSVSAAALPLPAGAATESTLGALATALGSLLTALGLLPRRPANVATGQAVVGTSATPIVAARAGRSSVTLINLGTTDVYVGGSGVTAATGLLLIGAKGGGLVIDGEAAIYAIAAGAQTISFMETY